MKQKLKIAPIFALLLFLIAFNACKKDLITVNTEKFYGERKVKPASGWGDGMSLTLKTNGTATLVEGGDMATEGKYKIKGEKLIFKVFGSKDRNFTIASEQEIHADSGEVLFLYAK